MGDLQAPRAGDRADLSLKLAEDEPKKRGLPGPVRPDEPHLLAALNLPVQRVEHG